MRITGQGPRGQIIEGILAPPGVKYPGGRIAAEHMHHLQIEEMRGMEGLPRGEQAHLNGWGLRRLEEHLKDGHLSKLDVAFSRDQPEKVYVQHRMLERAKELYGWLQEGAHFYVCGDASRMAHDVHEALIAVVEKEGKLPRDAAEAYVEDLKKSKRYQRDVY